MHCSIDQCDIHGTSTRRLRHGHLEFMDLRDYAYLAYLLPPAQLPGRLSPVAGLLIVETLVTASRQHNLKIIPQLPKLPRINRGDGP